jgi:hypothetical protein
VRAGHRNDLDVVIREIDFKISLIETQPEPDVEENPLAAPAEAGVRMPEAGPDYTPVRA